MAKNQATSVVAHNAITGTATSTAIDCRGYNAVYVEIAITVAAVNWTVSLLGSSSAGGTYSALYVDATAVSKQTATTYAGMWRGVPDWVKVLATEDVDTGKCTVTITPCNV